MRKMKIRELDINVNYVIKYYPIPVRALSGSLIIEDPKILPIYFSEQSRKWFIKTEPFAFQLSKVLEYEIFTLKEDPEYFL